MKKVLAAVALVLAGFALMATLKKAPPAAPEHRLPSFGMIHEFALTRENGAAFPSSELNGKVWVASFMFTRCHGPCPMMSQKFARLQKELASDDGIRLVSISMDPSYDSPEVMKAYGEKYAADPARWFFLTGDKESIIRMATEAFKLPAGEDPDMHSTRFVLVDGSGQIRGYYDSTDAQALENLKLHARSLSQAKPAV